MDGGAGAYVLLPAHESKEIEKIIKQEMINLR
jgi:hypothetical protein